ncbi:MAG: efflux RND transporter permease subunit [Magnetospirillum sp. WYHS-4]
MHGFIEGAFERSRLVLSTLVFLLVAGIVTFATIPKEADPDVNIPILYVKMVHEGISPEDAERLLVRPMEQKLRAIEGIKEMRASAFEGGANVVLEFEAGFDVDLAMNDVRQKVDLAKPDLPKDTEEPTVHEVNFSLFPVLLVSLAGDIPERALIRLARDLKESVESLSQVLEVRIAGDREEAVEILIDPIKVESYGLTPDEALRSVGASNKLVAAGSQDTGHGRFAVKVPGLYEGIQDIVQQPVKVDGDAVVHLGDIGEARRTYKDPESFARVNGRPALVLEVVKRTGQNIIETIAAVQEAVETERRNWPEPVRQAVRVSFLQDKSDDIRTMLNDLNNSVITASLLVVIVVVGALGGRSSALVAIAIPGSFLAAILLVGMMGMTINIVVLFSLIMAVGMLVDGAVVVTEYADRKMLEGMSRTEAYALSTRHMFAPVVSSTLTTIAAFLPLMFWPGVVGQFMRYLPMTLMATLGASIAMALLFVPVLGALFGRPGSGEQEDMRLLADAAPVDDLRRLHGPLGLYVKVLDKALDHPGKVVIASVALLFGVQFLYGAIGKGVEFFPDVEPKFAKLQVKARGNLSIFEKDALMREVEARVLGMPELASVYSRTGREQMSEDAEDVIGSLTFEFVDWKKRRKAPEILAEAKARTADLAGIQVEIRKEEAGPPVGKPIQVELSAREPALLPPAAAKVRAFLEAMPGLRNVEDSRPLPGIDWQIAVDRPQAAKFGASVGAVGQSVQMLTNGFKLGAYRPDDSTDEIDIIVRYPPEYRTIERLDHVRVAGQDGAVPISSFVTREARQKVGTVNRTDGRRVMAVKADVEEGVLPADKVPVIAAWIAREAGLDPGIKVRFKGEDEEQKKAEAFLLKAFGVALALIGVILIAQFNSFFSALLILSAVVMSTLGVFVGLMVMDQPFGIVMTGIGVIALAGVIVNNNIVLIDTFDRLRRETGLNLRDAVVKTGAQRVRPVFLTAFTAVLGLLPMMLQLNVDFVAREATVGAPAMQWWTQLATAMVFGLGFATVLTLIVTPCALMFRGGGLRRRIADRLWLAWARRRAGLQSTTSNRR